MFVLGKAINAQIGTLNYVKSLFKRDISRRDQQADLYQNAAWAHSTGGSGS